MSSLRPPALFAALLGTLVALAACGRAERGASSGDSVAADAAADSLPPLPPSILDVPVAYDLAPAVAALEAAVPRRFGSLDERRPVPSHPRLAVAFAAERSPFVVRVEGTTAVVEAIVTYRGRGWYALPLAPDVAASCGSAQEAPRLRLTLATSVQLAPDWSLRSRTRVPVVAPASDATRDRCRVTVLRYDVTERVLDAARRQLEGKAALVDAHVARADVRGRVARWWTLLQRPIRVHDSLWLEIRPVAVRLGTVRAEDGALVAPLRLVAHPRIVSGPRPDSGTVPLPQLGDTAVAGAAAADTAAAGGLRVRIDARLDYAVATRMLAGRVVGRTFERGGQRVVVRGAAVRAAPRGRVALLLDVDGAATGTVRLVGRPTLDVAAGELSVPDLDYDVDTDHVLVRGLDWLKHGDLRDTLRARARWPTGALLDRARGRLAQALNRDLADGVRLAAVVPTARALDVRAAADALVLRAEAVGSASLRVTRAPGRRPRRVAAGAPPDR